MALKGILVHVDSSNASEKRLTTAVNLAKAHDAHLIGLFVKYIAPIPDIPSPELIEQIFEAQEKAANEGAEKAEALFNEAVNHEGVVGEWRCITGDPVEQLAMHGRYVDTVIIGQNNPDADVDPGTYDLPDRLILSIGRPVITIPYVGDYPVMGKRVLVSWDASRLATRAVNDALPLLQLADQVDVLAINPEGGAEGHGEIPAADICQHLARHGVNAEAKSITAKDMNVGDTLLSRASDFSSDLIVMGGYGHRRLRELVLGGVTRHLLKHMTAPVMMSH